MGISRPTLRRLCVVCLLVVLVVVVESKKAKAKVAAPPPLADQISAALGDAIAWVQQPKIIVPLALFASPLAFAPKHAGDFVSEMVGTIVMVFFTFTPGPFQGHRGVTTEWMLHALGVMIADWTCGGPHVNPCVTAAIWAWGKISVTQSIVHIGGQMAGGILAFPALQGVSTLFDVTIGGPQFDPSAVGTNAAMWNEFSGCFLLLLVVFVFATTWFGDGAYENTKRANAVYLRKQACIAAGIRLIIWSRPATGPAVNAMLGTTWAFYKTGAFPTDPAHYLVYWVGGISGAVLAALIWSARTSTGMFAPSKAKTA